MTVRSGPARTLVGVALAAAVLLGGCARSVGGTADAERWSATKVAGLEITTGESGPRPGVADSRLVAVGGDDGELDRLARNAVDDVQRYWSEQLPSAFGRRFDPVGTLISYDSTGPDATVCGTSTAGAVNAFYCGPDDSVAWDRGQLLPTLNDSFGPMSVVAVLAHEMGHAVQFRLGTADGRTSSIVKEQQADCYAGNFFRWVAEGDAPHFRLSTGPGLNQILAALFFIRDAAGTGFDAAGAHGNAFDRVSAFQFGFGEGPARCARIDEGEVRRRITQPASAQAAPPDADDGNLPVADQDALQALHQTLRAAFDQPGAASPVISTTPPACPEVTGTAPASYCPRTNVVGLDLADLASIGTPPEQGTGGGLGDFAAFAEVASRYALAAQHAAGYPLTGLATAQRTACLTGFWAATIVVGRGALLQLSPGDLDEAVAEMLAPRSLIAADVNGAGIPSGFARVEAFRDGFSGGGTAPCLAKYR
ncbi:neutral zinc metallopeptidase [Micromonospora costi]|uniref:Aminopeptidase n=1 Tax=Micromonospora costi TaxID=1530042 RepID=A0A3A9ZTK3_9ACTN|nr:neutral zinc metallopeptidase [Micromonospora costi]RKN51565.1 aminopeptidase [Micromonospora costi]